MTRQSIVNKMRFKYASMEEAYLNENSIKTVPKCPECQRERIFKSFFKGYQATCGSNDCRYKNGTSKTLKRIKDTKEYNNQVIISNCLICNSSIKRKRNSKQITSNICNTEFCQKHKRYGCFDEKIIIDFKTDFIYLNDLVYRLKAEFNSNNKIRKILYRNLLRKNISDPKLFLHDIAIRNVIKLNISDLIKIEGIYFNKNDKYFDNTIKKYFQDDFLEIASKYFPDSINQCKICKNEYLNKTLIDNRLFSSENTCSLRCYRKNYKQFVTEERKAKQSNALKRKIASGQFIPNITNSWTSLKAYYVSCENEHKYRSIFELVFHILNPTLQYESNVIPYSYKNKNRNYIIDFTDNKNKKLYELKPLSLTDTHINIVKSNAALKWAEEEGYEYVIKTQYDIFNTSFKHFKTICNQRNIIINENILTKIKKYFDEYYNKN